MRQMRVFRNKYDSPAVVLDKIEWEAFLWVITAQVQKKWSEIMPGE
jgi:hypothetical protein